MDILLVRKRTIYLWHSLVNTHFITYVAKLLIADWLREGMNLVSLFRQILRKNFRNGSLN